MLYNSDTQLPTLTTTQQANSTVTTDSTQLRSTKTDWLTTEY